MSAPDVAPLTSDPLQALHQRLLARYKDELRAVRSSGPVFLLELDLTDKELKQADRLLRDALKGHPLRAEERSFWNQRYLPLLRVATEVGYLYQGTGTDYWPVLEARLGAGFPHLARRELRHLFDVFAAFCEVAVPDTPWAGQFPNIARPITHAILPRELHAPLLSALLASGVRRLRREDWPPLQAALLEQATRAGGRLPHFLRQDTVAEAVVRALAFDEIEGAPVAEHALRRIRADVLLAESARRLLKQVVERVRETPSLPPPPPPPQTGRTCPLLLVIEGDRLSLDVQIPASSFEPSEARRRPVRLFGGGRAISVDSLILGGREALLGVDLSAGPSGSRSLLRPEDAEQIAEGPLRRHLTSLQVDLSAPILLAAHLGPRDTARQVRERTFAARDGYWVLSAEEPEELPRGATRWDQRVCGLYAVEVDAREPAAQGWLRRLGLALTVQPRVRRLGAPPLGGRGAWESGLVVGDLLLLQVEGDAVPVAGQAEPLTPGLWRAALPTSGGRWTARLGAGATLSLELPVLERPPSPRLNVAVTLEGAEPSLDALLQRRLFARVTGALPLTGLRARLCLEAPEGLVLETETDPLPALPAVIPSDAPCWLALARALDERGLVGLRLRIEIGAVATGTWALPARETALWWEGSELVGDDPEVASDLRILRSPAARPLDLEEGAGDSGGFALRVPVDARGRPLPGLAMLDGPTRSELWTLSSVLQPNRLLRRLRGGQDEREGVIGARRLADGLIRWSGARSAHGVAELARRGVVRALDAWLTEALCGQDWLTRERALDAPARPLSAHVACALMASALAIDELARDHLAKQIAPRPAEPLIEQELTRALQPLEPWLEAFSAERVISDDELSAILQAIQRAYHEAARGRPAKDAGGTGSAVLAPGGADPAQGGRGQIQRRGDLRLALSREHGSGG